MLKNIKKFIFNKHKIPIILSIFMFFVLVAIFIFFMVDLGLSISESVKSPVNSGVKDFKSVGFDIEGFKNLNLDR